jgi:hypothetical protein
MTSARLSVPCGRCFGTRGISVRCRRLDNLLRIFDHAREAVLNSKELRRQIVAALREEADEADALPNAQHSAVVRL